MFQGMEYVYAVYRTRSFSKAAKELFISQPSLSANVKRIEKKIGYPLFDRSTKPLGLTECGEHYMQSVEKILAAEKEFVDFVNDWGGLKTGNLVLGGSTLYSSWMLPVMMGRFSRKYPQVELVLVEESTANLEEMLQSGKLDLMLDNCELDAELYGRYVVQREHLLLAVPTGSEINRHLEPYQVPAEQIRDGSFLQTQVRAVALEAFREEPFVVLKPENDTRKRAMELCQEHGFAPHIVFELDQQMTSYNITCSGIGSSFISDTLVARVPDNHKVVYYKLDSEKSSRNISIYWKKGRYFSRAMEAFLNGL
ncbi:MAG: LysR family transcriptional regulator [Lachnospiraceae bacterium]|nr:LysR family transcriptional regulator [Lachnospiraceae bacterium]